MKIIKNALLLMSFFAVLPLSLALAAGNAPKNGDSPKEEITPITQWIDAENALLKTLPAQNQKVFFVFRNKHSVMRSVEVVRRDVKNAVKACSKANPEMKDTMNNRFKEWDDAITPILTESEKFLAQELNEQEAFHSTDYKHVMALNDKAYKFSESKVEKTPVTTPEACQGLLNSMDRSEEKLINLLQDILLPEEVIRKRVERMEEQEEKAQQ